MISRVQGLPTGYVVTGSDLENVAGGFPDAKSMYSMLLWKNVNWIRQKLKRFGGCRSQRIRDRHLTRTGWLARWLGFATLRL